MAKAYIFLNGDFEKPTLNWPDQPAPEDFIIAVDGGTRHPAQLGWPIHCLVGDLDSINPDLLALVEASEAEILRYPTDKDEIDFELALKLAYRRGYMKIEVLGALGGRWDMAFGNLLVPTGVDWASNCLRFRHGPWNMAVVSGPTKLTLKGQPGDTLSLLPLGDDARSVTLDGCRYSLNRETLQAGLSRGISNELIHQEATLAFEGGTILVMHQSSS